MNSRLIFSLVWVAFVAVYISDVFDSEKGEVVSRGKMEENDRLASKAVWNAGMRREWRSGCFPGEATITLVNGDVISMTELRVGHYVLAATRDGAPIFSKVVAWLERIPDERVSYKYLSTATGKTLALSTDHVLFTVDGNKLTSRPAKDVGVGDLLRVVSSNGSASSEVTHVDHKFAKGEYVPVTEHGTIVIDGVMASCYVSADHDLTHAWLTPLRMFPGLFLDPIGDPDRAGTRPLISLFHVAYKLLFGEERHINYDRKVEVLTGPQKLHNSCPNTLFLGPVSTRA